MIAVLGGLKRIEGAWIGAALFAVMQNYLPSIDQLGEQWHTAVGALFLLTVLISPDGMLGLWERVLARLGRPGRGSEPAPESAAR